MVEEIEGGTFVTFVDYVALVYHEARNVRHLVRAGAVEKAPYRLLIDSLPKNRDRAWASIQRHRTAALSQRDAGSVCEVFAGAYALSLDEVVSMFELPYWKDAAPGYAGNRWVEIGQAVVELRDALASGEQRRASELAESIHAMNHNTGVVGDKVQELEASLSRSSG